MPKPSDLAALLEAATSSGRGDYPGSGDVGKARQQLYDLAPALAQEVLDQREAGGALAEAFEHRDHCECCIECLHPCTEFQELSAAAFNRWAELAETEVRDGQP